MDDEEDGMTMIELTDDDKGNEAKQRSGKTKKKRN